MNPETIYNLMLGFFVFLFGVTIGSFLNVCIYRLPKGESLVKSNSHCMTCGSEIKRYDLIPILSWLILRGKCRHCGAKISPRYITVESLTGILFVLCYVCYSPFTYGMYFAALALFISGLIVLAFQDYDTSEMCVSVIVYTFIIAIATHIINHIDTIGRYLTMPETLNNCLIGAVSVSGIILIFGFVITPAVYVLFLSQDHKDRRRLEKALSDETNPGKRKQITAKLDQVNKSIKETGPVFGFGMGDVLVMASGGLMLGWKAAVTAGTFAIFAGAVYAIYKSATAEEGDEDAGRFPFGPFLIAGLIIGAYFGNSIADAYIDYMRF